MSNLRKKIIAKRVNRSFAGSLGMFSFLVIIGAFMIMPLVYVINNAFKPLDELFVFPPRFFVKNPTTENFTNLLALLSSSRMPFSRYLFNTTFVTVAGTVGQLFLSSLCAFALAKHKFKGRNLIFQLIVLSLMFSAAVTAVPNYMTMAKLHLVDTYLAVLLPSFQTTLGLYLMKQFMEIVPDAILEAARIDGAREFVIYWRIMMPQVKPAWLTLIILCIQSLWNSSSPYTYSEQLKTLPQALSQILSGGISRAGVGSAIGLIMLIVPITSFLITQSNIIETMSTSGMKE